MPIVVGLFRLKLFPRLDFPMSLSLLCEIITTLKRLLVLLLALQDMQAL